MACRRARHAVFVTQHRRQVFSSRHLGRRERIMRDVRADSGAEPAELTGQAEHVHLPVNFPPTVAISRLVNSLTGLSSRRRRQEHADLRRHYWQAKRLWSGPCFAGSAGGPPITVLRQHIEQHNRPVPARSRPAAFTTGLKAGAPAAR